MPNIKEAKSYNIQEKPEVIHHVMKLGRGHCLADSAISFVGSQSNLLGQCRYKNKCTVGSENYSRAQD